MDFRLEVLWAKSGMRVVPVIKWPRNLYQGWSSGLCSAITLFSSFSQSDILIVYINLKLSCDLKIFHDILSFNMRCFPFSMLNILYFLDWLNMYHLFFRLIKHQTETVACIFAQRQEKVQLESGDEGNRHSQSRDRE